MRELHELANRHSGWSGLQETIENEIRRNGIDPTQGTVDELAPVDNYHWHRLAGTVALARAASISPADGVLDVGGGVGGAAPPRAARERGPRTGLGLTAPDWAGGVERTAW